MFRVPRRLLCAIGASLALVSCSSSSAPTTTNPTSPSASGPAVSIAGNWTATLTPASGATIQLTATLTEDTGTGDVSGTFANASGAAGTDIGFLSGNIANTTALSGMFTLNTTACSNSATVTGTAATGNFTLKSTQGFPGSQPCNYGGGPFTLQFSQ
jgi:hypothetical protein